MSFTPNARRRQAWAFQIGRQNGLRTSNNVVDQLEGQLHAEREQHAFDVAEMQKSIDMLLRDLMQAKYELARRNLADKFVSTPSPSAMVH